MPPKASNQETVLFVVNVGLTKRAETNKEIFVEKAKGVIQRLIEQKIFLRPQDLNAILVTGTNPNKCVEVFFELQVACWEMIEKVLTLKSTDVYTNWIDALDETISYMKGNMPAHPIYSTLKPMRKIIMISDFNTDWNKTKHDYEFSKIRLNSDNIQLLAMGTDELYEDPTQCSQSFLHKLIKNTSGSYVTLDSAANDLKFYKVPPKKPYPWYATLEITPSIKIPIVAYVKVEERTKFPSWKVTRDDENVVTKKQSLDKWRNSYTEEQKVKGYKYGNEFHAVSEVHEAAMRYSSGPRSYQLCGFTKIAYIGIDRWAHASSTRAVFPSTKTAAAEFYSLVQVMSTKHLAAVVRKVHNTNMVPRMVALFPRVSSTEPWCLAEITLPYREDGRVLVTRPIKGLLKEATKQQHEAVDNLLDSLLLNTSEAESEDVEEVMVIDLEPEDLESFMPGSVGNPVRQHKWHMLSHRALYPEKPLPPVDNYLLEALRVPSIEDKCKKPLELVKSLFRTEKLVPKKKGQQANSADDAKETATGGEQKSAMDTADALNAVPDDLMIDMSDLDLDDLDTI